MSSITQSGKVWCLESMGLDLSLGPVANKLGGHGKVNSPFECKMKITLVIFAL